jgi:hypothetical protein
LGGAPIPTRARSLKDACNVCFRRLGDEADHIAAQANEPPAQLSASAMDTAAWVAPAPLLLFLKKSVFNIKCHVWIWGHIKD